MKITGVAEDRKALKITVTAWLFRPNLAKLIWHTERRGKWTACIWKQPYCYIPYSFLSIDQQFLEGCKSSDRTRTFYIHRQDNHPFLVMLLSLKDKTTDCGFRWRWVLVVLTSLGWFWSVNEELNERPLLRNLLVITKDPPAGFISLLYARLNRNKNLFWMKVMLLSW